MLTVINLGEKQVIATVIGAPGAKNTRVGWPAGRVPDGFPNTEEVRLKPGWQTLLVPTKELTFVPEGNLVIKERQIKWANERNLKLVAGGSDESDTVYVNDVTENLFMRLNSESIDEYNHALGGPLRAKGGQLPHLHSLTSSDAITANVFDYLRRGRLALVAECLPIPTDNIVSFKFERQFQFMQNAMGWPNVDAVFGYASASPLHLVGAECKLTEPYPAKSRPMMNKAYLQNNEWWQGLGALKELALEFVGEGNESIERYLDRGQLIKHILGMAHESRKHGGGASRVKLLYIWYDVATIESELHQQEITEFKNILDQTDAQFEAITWQDLIDRIVERCGESDKDYTDYIVSRYL